MRTGVGEILHEDRYKKTRYLVGRSQIPQILQLGTEMSGAKPDVVSQQPESARPLAG